MIAQNISAFHPDPPAVAESAGLLGGLAKRLLVASAAATYPVQEAAGEPAFARFALSGNVLPKLTRALSIGERFREALMSWSKGHVLFSGRDPENLDDTGNPLPVQGHPHCWYLSEDVDGDGFIDHVLVYAAKGFDEKALKALRDLKKVWSNETSEGEFQTILIQLGRVKDYATTLESRIPGVSPLIAKATTWRSLTPMVLPRHFKRNPKLDPASQLLIDSPEHQVLSQIRCLRKHDLLKFSEPPGWTWKNHILVTQEGFDGLYPWYAYQRLRQKGNGSHAGNKAYWVEITFPEAIVGPLALGYAAHFGLGVFMPCLKKMANHQQGFECRRKNWLKASCPRFFRGMPLKTRFANPSNPYGSRIFAQTLLEKRRKIATIGQVCQFAPANAHPISILTPCPLTVVFPHSPFEGFVS